MVKLASVENSFLHSLGSDAAAQGQCQDTRRDRGTAGAAVLPLWAGVGVQGDTCPQSNSNQQSCPRSKLVGKHNWQITQL